MSCFLVAHPMDATSRHDQQPSSTTFRFEETEESNCNSNTISEPQGAVNRALIARDIRAIYAGSR